MYVTTVPPIPLRVFISDHANIATVPHVMVPEVFITGLCNVMFMYVQVRTEGTFQWI